MRALVELVIYPSFFAAPVFGIIGIMNDRRKFFAVVSVAIAVGVLFFIFICQRLSAYYGIMIP